MRIKESQNFIDEIGPIAEAESQAIGPASGDANQRPALTLDVALYESMLDDPGLSAADRAAFIESLWSIIVSFVDLGFHIHPLQQVETPVRTDEDKTTEILAMSPADVVKLQGLFPKQQFAKAAGHPSQEKPGQDDS